MYMFMNCVVGYFLLVCTIVGIYVLKYLITNKKYNGKSTKET
jgi:hypothetical protein